MFSSMLRNEIPKCPKKLHWKQESTVRKHWITINKSVKSPVKKTVTKPKVKMSTFVITIIQDKIVLRKYKSWRSFWQKKISFRFLKRNWGFKFDIIVNIHFCLQVILLKLMDVHQLIDMKTALTSKNFFPLWFGTIWGCSRDLWRFRVQNQ